MVDGDLVFFFSNSQSENWKMGALAGSRSYKETRKFAGGTPPHPESGQLRAVPAER